jgi:hypothetical protein
MTDVADPTMSYEGLVEAGRAAREQADSMQWVEGDLALQVEALPADERPRDPESGLFIEDEAKTLKRYAEDVDIAYPVMRDYRWVAEAWPRRSRADEVSWRTHRVLAGQPDRFDLVRPGMTVREAEKLVRDRTAGNQGKPGWLELIGQVGDDLIKAEKNLDKFDAAIAEKDPTENVRGKAGRYAAMAEELALRLRRIEAAV